MRSTAAAFLAASLAACRAAAPKPGASPSQVLDRFSMSRSEKGVRQWTLTAAEAILKEQGGLAVLKTPDIRLYRAGKATTAVRARHGLLHTQTQDVDLEGDVVVTSLQDRSVLKTDALDYLSVSKQFKTDRPVVIERPGSTMRGRGLTASQDLSEIHIYKQESKVY